MMITHPGADGRCQPPKRCPASGPGSAPGMRDLKWNGSDMMIMKECASSAFVRQFGESPDPEKP